MRSHLSCVVGACIDSALRLEISTVPYSQRVELLRLQVVLGKLCLSCSPRSHGPSAVAESVRQRVAHEEMLGQQAWNARLPVVEANARWSWDKNAVVKQHGRQIQVNCTKWNINSKWKKYEPAERYERDSSLAVAFSFGCARRASVASAQEGASRRPVPGAPSESRLATAHGRGLVCTGRHGRLRGLPRLAPRARRTHGDAAVTVEQDDQPARSRKCRIYCRTPCRSCVECWSWRRPRPAGRLACGSGDGIGEPRRAWRVAEAGRKPLEGGIGWKLMRPG